MASLADRNVPLARGTSLAVVLALALCVPAQDAHPLSEVEVHRWVAELSADAFERRAAAVERLVAAGPGIRPWIEALRETVSVEGRLRLDSILARWVQVPGTDRPLHAQGTKVTLSAKGLPLTEILARLGATADTPLRWADVPVVGAPGPRAISFEVVDEPFWKALDALCAQEGLRHERHPSGDLALLASPGAAGPVAYPGPFRIALTAFSVTRMTNFFTDPTVHANLQMAVDAENGTQVLGLAGPPRLKRGVDDQGRPVESANQGGAYLVPLSRQQRAHVSLALRPPPRDATEISDLELDISVVVLRELTSTSAAIVAATAIPTAPLGPIGLVIEEVTPLDGMVRVRVSWNPNPPECDQPGALRVQPHSRIRFLDPFGVELPTGGVSASWIVGSPRSQVFTVQGGPLAEVLVEHVTRYGIDSVTATFAKLPLP